jgi:hypothetical protein
MKRPSRFSAAVDGLRIAPVFGCIRRQKDRSA